MGRPFALDKVKSYNHDHSMGITSRHHRSGLPRRLGPIKGLSVRRIGQAEADLQVARTGPDLTRYFNGTLNIDIRPHTFRLIKPEYTFQHVEWTDLHPPEHFSFSLCKVIYKDVEYEGWVYYPHPETKLRDFQDPSLLEVIAYEIPEIKYGDEVQVLVNPEEIEVSQTT